MNDAVLKALGGAWNHPPDPPVDWESGWRLRWLRKKALRLLSRRAPREPWGWKDPRNCLTLPFWRSVVPIDKVLILLRHPLESAESFERARGIPVPEGLRLWAIYNQRIMESSSPEERLICHVHSFYRDPEAFIRRVLGFLGLPILAAGTTAALDLFKNDRRRHFYPTDFTGDSRLFPSLIDLYTRQCAEANAASQVHRDVEFPLLAPDRHCRVLFPDSTTAFRHHSVS